MGGNPRGAAEVAVALRGQANVWTPALDFGDVSSGPRAAGVIAQWAQLLAEQTGFASPGPPQGDPVLLPFSGLHPVWGVLSSVG